MALPSAVTLASGAFIIAAGVGLVAMTSSADEAPSTASSTSSDGSENDADRQGAGTSAATKPAPNNDGPTSTPQKPDKPDRSTKPDKRKRATPDVVPRVFVEVYNNSGITGLAAETAAGLEGAGWNVVATDNWYGAIPVSTVYHPQGMRAEAGQLARELGYSRVRPAVEPMQSDRLTVIITSA